MEGDQEQFAFEILHNRKVHNFKEFGVAYSIFHSKNCYASDVV